MRLRSLVMLTSAVVLALPSVGRAEATNLAVWGAPLGEPAPSGTDFVAVSGGTAVAVALRADGTLASWGENNDGVHEVPPGDDYVAVALGQFHGYALKSSGEIVGWGTSVDGNLDVPSAQNFASIASGAGHGLALTPEGMIVGWGYNEYGQATAPSGSGYTAVAAGVRHSVALRADGSIITWGDNTYGQLATPSGNDFVKIAAGGDTSVALRSDGSLVGWGWDDSGVAHPPSGHDFVDMAVGLHGIARRADGTLVGWGRDGNGQASPPSGSGFGDVAVGTQFSIAVTDGALTEPRSVRAVAGHGEAIVSWLPPASDAGSPVTSYEVLSSADWQACTTDGALSCTVGGLQNGKAYTFTVRAFNDIGPGPWSAPSAAVTPFADPFGEFTPLAPARILDTRTGVGRNGVVGPLQENTPIELQVTGQGGVASSGVVAVVMNVTVTQPTTRSYLTVWPSDVPQPGSSNLNYVAGQTIPNHVTVAVSDLGRVKVMNRFGTAHVIFDVVGFYADDPGPAGSRYHSVDPARLFDTRSGLGGVPAAPVGTAGTLAFNVLGKGGVPSAGVTAVVMNVTVARATEWSYLTVFPGDLTTPPLASNLNYLPGQAVPNLVTVRVPADGIVKFYNQFGTVHVIADVVGYFDEDRFTEAGRFIPLDPYRYYDSREYNDPWGPDEAWLLGDYPGFGGLRVGEAEAVVLNVTAAGATAWSYLSVFPAHLCSLPNVSNLNFTAGPPVPNQVITRLATSGGCAEPDELETIAVYNYDGIVHVIVDVFGIFTSPTTTLFE